MLFRNQDLVLLLLIKTNRHNDPGTKDCLVDNVGNSNVRSFAGHPAGMSKDGLLAMGMMLSMVFAVGTSEMVSLLYWGRISVSRESLMYFVILFICGKKIK